MLTDDYFSEFVTVSESSTEVQVTCDLGLQLNPDNLLADDSTPDPAGTSLFPLNSLNLLLHLSKRKKNKNLCLASSTIKLISEKKLFLCIIFLLLFTEQSSMIMYITTVEMMLKFFIQKVFLVQEAK